MYVIKRDGRKVPARFDKITERIRNLCNGLALATDEKTPGISPELVAHKVITGMPETRVLHTSELDEIAAEEAANMVKSHPHYAELAGRLLVANLHKETPSTFSDAMQAIQDNDPAYPFLDNEFLAYVQKHATTLDAAIVHANDYKYDYFSMRTLLRSYLNIVQVEQKNAEGKMEVVDKVIERPQYMIMRVCVHIHMGNLPKVLEAYRLASSLAYTHASPTLFNSGKARTTDEDGNARGPQLASCFLLQMMADSIEGIYDTLKRTAQISKMAGGIGLAVSCIRAAGSTIRSSRGRSDGLVPMLRVFNNTARYVDQCFEPSTMVYTKRGPLAIGDVQPNDELVSETGKYQKVLEVVHHGDSARAVQMSTKHMLEPVVVTEAHPFLAIRNQRKMTNFATILNRLDKKYVVSEYVEAADLKESDLVAYAIPTFEEDVPDYSEDDCRMFGIMIGDGHISGTNRQMHVTLHAINKAATATFVRRYLESRVIHVTESRGRDSTLRLTWNAPHWFKITRQMLYDEDGEKLLPAHLLHLPMDKIKAVVRGILETDGSVGGEVTLEMTSKQVIYGVRYMLLRMGVLTSGYYRNRVGQQHPIREGLIECKKPSWVLRIPKAREVAELVGIPVGKYVNYLRHGNLLYSRVTSVRPAGDITDSVDLRMKGDPNYLTTAGTAHNGGGKRKGAFAIYLEPWHADVFEFLDLRKNHGKEEHRARDLFYGLWVPDLFMQRVEAQENWSLFCPAEVRRYQEQNGLPVKGLQEVHSQEFKAMYEDLERAGVARRTFPAQDLWWKILESQSETGTPYLLYKDACNAKSNQQNLGTIQCSNLCTEIVEYTSPNEVAVCNLASISLPYCVVGGRFDFQRLHDVAYLVTENLNRVVDLTFYPVDAARNSNLRHRPIGIGVQGLADAFVMLGLSYESKEAQELNTRIFEVIYHAALNASADLAAEHGAYDTYPGSPASRGILQYDMWEVTPPNTAPCDWLATKAKIAEHGLRNSLLLAPMPTASSAQIMGNNEGTAAFTSNYYVRRTNAGEFPLFNKHLSGILLQRNLWTTGILNRIIEDKGSVQNVVELDEETRELFKTVWEMYPPTMIDMAADRGAFIDQSQSFNAWIAEPNFQTLTAYHFYAWKKGLKTGMYYLRSKAAADAVQFTLRPGSKSSEDEEREQQALVCSLVNKEACLSCQA